MKILVINAGSSSIKYQLFDMETSRALISGAIECIGEKESCHKFSTHAPNIQQSHCHRVQIENHQQGFHHIETALENSGIVARLSTLDGIGHRVVHGGNRYHHPLRIDEPALNNLRETIALAPLHNAANILGIEVFMKSAPCVPQVAVFDTAFHQTIPEQAYRYALPNELYNTHNIRRYGFHGCSHSFVSRQAAEILKKPIESLKLISLHLGNGASAAAISCGQCLDTSMGFTPLEGLMMGTRCGDMDPSIPLYLNKIGYSFDEIERLLNYDSGLKGICGLNDMRAIHQLADQGDSNAKLARDMFAYRIKKYIGAYAAVLGGLDALVFTGGIGENDAWMRQQCCAHMEFLGIALDTHKNNQARGKTDISHGDSEVSLLVIPTNEELEIALQTLSVIN